MNYVNCSQMLDHKAQHKTKRIIKAEKIGDSSDVNVFMYLVSLVVF